MSDSLHMVDLAKGEKMVRVTVPQRDHGVIVKDGRVAHAAPPLKWLVGKTVGRAKAWCTANGCTWNEGGGVP